MTGRAFMFFEFVQGFIHDKMKPQERARDLSSSLERLERSEQICKAWETWISKTAIFYWRE